MASDRVPAENNAADADPTSLEGSKDVSSAMFDALMDNAKALVINDQKTLEGVVDLIFEKAIDDPNFSEAYANMCNKLYKLKVPADNATSPNQCVNLSALIIGRCQTEFMTEKTNEAVTKLEKELGECTDPVRVKMLTLMLAEENKKMRMRFVGIVRFIGELYKLKMLTSKIMVYCMNHLVDKLEEEKLECLCVLLTTIGEQVEGEVWEQLDAMFEKMQDILDHKSSEISSRVRFMIQAVIGLQKRWVAKSAVGIQPKMMDQIQEEAERHQRQIELMNSAPPMSGGFRRTKGGRGSNPKRNYGSNTAQKPSNSFMSLPTNTTNMYNRRSKTKATDYTSLRDSKYEFSREFDALMDKVKALRINDQKRLEGFVDLIFETAINDPDFSEICAYLCNKLYKLKVPADNGTSPDQCVNFRAVIIGRCQTEFVTEKTNEAVTKLEKELGECTDPVKENELNLMLAEENKKMRMRSAGNVRFIGELYKLKMLTSKIMVYCMNHLVDKLEEEKLECLCVLLTTIGEQVEGEVRDQLDAVFKKMQDIVDRKSSKISSRVRFMIEDVIELRKRRWVAKSAVGIQPKMMDQIHEETEKHQDKLEHIVSALIELIETWDSRL